jgi:hypothetical protein
VLQHAERGLADRDEGGGGLEGERRRLRYRAVEQGVLTVAAADGRDAEDRVADRGARAIPGGIDHACYVPTGETRKLSGEDSVELAAADLGVDRVDGDGPHPDPDLTGAGCRDLRLGQRQDFRAAVAGVGDDGVHRMLLVLGLNSVRPE